MKIEELPNILNMLDCALFTNCLVNVERLTQTHV